MKHVSSFALATVFSLLFPYHFSTADDKAEGTAAAAAIYISADDTDALKAKEGQKITVYGNTSGSGKSQSGTNFVNFKGAEFYLITFASDLDQFTEGEPHEVYDEQRIAVTGTLTIYKDKPQIKLTEPGMIQVIAEGETFPPKMEEKAPAVAPETTAKAEPKKENAKPEEPKRKPPVDAKKYFK